MYVAAAVVVVVVAVAVAVAVLCVGVETNYKNPDQTKLKKNILGLKLENDANKDSDD